MRSRLRAGTLNHRVTLQALVTEQDDSDGNVTESYVSAGDVWADVRPVSGKEYVQADAQQSKIMTTIKIRWRAGMEPSMRVIHRGRTFHVEQILEDPYTANEWLTLACSEVVTG